VVSFKKGNQPLQFSCANTLIDPTSVRLRFATHADTLELLDTTFPHSKPQMLYWNVQSELEDEATVEINLLHQRHPVGPPITSALPTRRNGNGLRGLRRWFSNSGEEYEMPDTPSRREINLVEKIAQLAKIP